MVVDDEGDSREFVSRFLSKSGHRVSSAQDGQDALHKLLHERPDVVVLDVRMPQMDGVGLLEIMRSYLRWHHVPVVVLSSSDEPQDVTESYRAGANSYVRKPVEFEAFGEIAHRVGDYWLSVNERPYRDTP